MVRTTREIVFLGDTYGVEIEEEEDDLLLLASVVVIDRVCHENRRQGQ